LSEFQLSDYTGTALDFELRAQYVTEYTASVRTILNSIPNFFVFHLVVKKKIKKTYMFAQNKSELCKKSGELLLDREELIFAKKVTNS